MAPVHYHQGAFPPTERLDWQQLAPFVASTSLEIGRYANALDNLPNTYVLNSIFSRKEAESSSRIEGTQASMEEVLRYEAGQEPVSRYQEEEFQELINYQRPMYQAKELLDSQQLSLDVILDIHHTLLSGVRGQDKNPGAFRAIDIHIGNPGSTIHDARFVPARIGKMYDLLDTWLSYTLHDRSILLVKVALMHAEFEAIHPFSDGNGRLGRILIPLMMWKYGLIPEPLFNVSVRLEHLRDEYIDHLESVSSKDDWTGWCVFLLEAMEKQTVSDLTRIQHINSLHESMKDRMIEVGRSKYGIHVLDGVFNRPIFTTSQLVKETGVPVRAAQRILERMRDSGILTKVEPGRGQFPAVFLFTELLRIAEGETSFE